MFAAHDLSAATGRCWGMPGENDGRSRCACRSHRDCKKQAVVANGRFAATNWTMQRRLPPSPALSNAGWKPTNASDQGPYGASRAWCCRRPGLWPALAKRPDAGRAARDCLAEMRRFPRQALHAASLGLAIRDRRAAGIHLHPAGHGRAHHRHRGRHPDPRHRPPGTSGWPGPQAP